MSLSTLRMRQASPIKISNKMSGARNAREISAEYYNEYYSSGLLRTYLHCMWMNVGDNSVSSPDFRSVGCGCVADGLAEVLCENNNFYCDCKTKKHAKLQLKYFKSKKTKCSSVVVVSSLLKQSKFFFMVFRWGCPFQIHYALVMCCAHIRHLPVKLCKS